MPATGYVKVIGTNGQISLGKRFAGRQVLVEEREPGVWLIRTATVVPDNERWLQHPVAMNDLRSALDWSSKNPADDSEVETIITSIAGGCCR